MQQLRMELVAPRTATLSAGIGRMETAVLCMASVEIQALIVVLAVNQETVSPPLMFLPQVQAPHQLL
jgi:hypothetical protein